MARRFGFLVLFCSVQIGCMGQKTPNRLIHQHSPYLRQHAYNPVDWYPWGEEAFEKARRENKLLIISIGYASCHWCHVMEKESFEDEEVAQIMNTYFVPIKVDREEHPDVDAVYMDAVQLMTGRGGWPLNAFALPDGRPIAGGTYFPKAQWKALCSHIAQLWKHNPERVYAYAERLHDVLKDLQRDGLELNRKTLSEEAIRDAIASWKKRFDTQWGGEKQVPKFILPANWLALINYAITVQDTSLLQFVFFTLERIAKGGIFDHVGGGFARYSTDHFWHIPHFEKMLYDNAQLIHLYAVAYAVSQNPCFRKVVEKTVNFLPRDLSDGTLFYSALDADSEGEEGKYYTWTYEEIQNLVPHECKEKFLTLYDIARNGNWEANKNVLWIPNGDFPVNDPCIENALNLLLEYRKKRIPPETDTKILTGYNALALKSLLVAGRLLDRPDWIQKAMDAENVLRQKIYNSRHELSHQYLPDTFQPAYLEDYAFYIDLLIELFSTTGEGHYLSFSQLLLKQVFEKFDQQPPYFVMSEQSPLIQKVPLIDNVVPSPNSVMALNLYRLGILLEEPSYLQRAEEMVFNLTTHLTKTPSYFGNWLNVAFHFVFPAYEVVICGPRAAAMAKPFLSHYHPLLFVCYSDKKVNLTIFQNRYPEGEEVLFYLCERGTCHLPQKDWKEVFHQVFKK